MACNGKASHIPILSPERREADATTNTGAGQGPCGETPAIPYSLFPIPCQFMNISYRWLQSIAPGLQGTPQQLAERLAMLGAPVDEIIDLGAQIGDVVIARVEEVRQHPNADRLRLCTVDAG